MIIEKSLDFIENVIEIKNIEIHEKQKKKDIYETANYLWKNKKNISSIEINNKNNKINKIEKLNCDELKDYNLKLYKDNIFLTEVDKMEQKIADCIYNFNNKKINDTNMNNKITEIEAKNGIKFNKDQRNFLENSLNYPISILLGKPGTGKTFLIKHLINMCNKKALMCSFTNKATIRMKSFFNQNNGCDCNENMSSFSSSENDYFGTIHKIYHNIEFYRDFGHNHILNFKILIVDECSMISLEIFDMLCDIIEYCNELENIIFIGDLNQLPPIGIGLPFKNIIQSDKFNNFKLDKVMRSENFSILKNANEIRKNGSKWLNNRVIDSSFEIKEYYQNDNNIIKIIKKDFKTLEDQKINKIISTTNKYCNLINHIIQEKIEGDYHYYYSEEDSYINNGLYYEYEGNEYHILKYSKNLGYIALKNSKEIIKVGNIKRKTYLKYKINDKVIFNCNDTSQKVYNGMEGNIIGFEKEHINVSLCENHNNIIKVYMFNNYIPEEWFVSKNIKSYNTINGGPFSKIYFEDESIIQIINKYISKDEKSILYPKETGLKYDIKIIDLSFSIKDNKKIKIYMVYKYKNVCYKKLLKEINDYNIEIVKSGIECKLEFKIISETYKIKLKANKVITYQNISLSYCITVNKSQGCEWDRIIYFPEINEYCLKNNHYTAITRAKKYIKFYLPKNNYIKKSMDKKISKNGEKINLRIEDKDNC